MTEYEKLRVDINGCLIDYESLVCLTVDKVIYTRRNSQIDLYLRIRRIESKFPPDCLVIVQLGFSKERIRMRNVLYLISDISNPQLRF